MNRQQKMWSVHLFIKQNQENIGNKKIINYLRRINENERNR